MPFLNFNFTARHLAVPEIIRDLLNNQGGSISVAVAIVRSEVELTRDVLLEALTILTRFQPALRMRIVTDSRKQDKLPAKRFVEMTNIDNGMKITEGVNRKSWLYIAEDELVDPFSVEEGPLWKLSYIGFEACASTRNSREGTQQASPMSEYSTTLPLDSTLLLQHNRSLRRTFTQPHEGALIFKIHQAIADDLSIFDLLNKQFLPILNGVLTSSDYLEYYKVPLFMLPTAQESFREKKKVTWQFKLKFKKSKTANNGSSQTPNFQPLWKLGPAEEVSEEQAIGRILPFALKDFSSKGFIERCTQHGVHLHAAMVTACAAAVSIQAFTNKLAVPQEIHCCFPIDLRQFRTLNSPHPLGLWTAYGLVKTRRFRGFVTAEKFWSEVEKVSKQVNASLEKPWKVFQNQKQALKTVAKTGDLSTLMAAEKAHIQVSTLDCSDVKNGRTSGVTEKNDWPLVNLEEYYSTNSMCDISNVPLAISSCLLRGRLMCTVTYNTKWVQRPFAVAFVDVLLRVIYDAVSEVDC